MTETVILRLRRIFVRLQGVEPAHSEVCVRAGIEMGNIKFHKITDIVDGFVLDEVMPAKNIEEVELEVLKEFSQIMKTEAHPSVTSSRLWMHSIPQFKVGYDKTDKLLTEFESEYKGLYIGGNYRWGVSVTDCIDAAKELAKKI